MNVNEQIALVLSDCGANAPGGGGFQKGNTCANGSEESKTTDPEIRKEWNRMSRDKSDEAWERAWADNDQEDSTSTLAAAIKNARETKKFQEGLKTQSATGEEQFKLYRKALPDLEDADIKELMSLKDTPIKGNKLEWTKSKRVKGKFVPGKSFGPQRLKIAPGIEKEVEIKNIWKKRSGGGYTGEAYIPGGSFIGQADNLVGNNWKIL